MVYFSWLRYPLSFPFDGSHNIPLIVIYSADVIDNIHSKNNNVLQIRNKSSRVRIRATDCCFHTVTSHNFLSIGKWRPRQQRTLSNRTMSQHITDLSVGRGNFLMLLMSLLISGAVNPCTRFLRARPRLRTCCLSVSAAPSSSSSSSSSDSSASSLVSVSSSYFLRCRCFFSAVSLSDSNWFDYTQID